MTSRRKWVKWAIRQIQADARRSADTHLLKLDLPSFRIHDVHLYLKDESTHPTGSLKHRLARSLFLYAICNGWIHEKSAVVEASSGSTAISEAYFSRLLGLPFYAVVPEKTSPQKVREIEFWGGTCMRVPPKEIYKEAAALAERLGGHYMDQFTYAERATDWRGNNNIAESIFAQMEREKYPDPRYIITGAGTGGTSATIGRYLRYHETCCAQTELVVADPDNSVFFDFFQDRDKSRTSEQCSRIEGIGRPRVEPSFIPEVIDKIIHVHDAESIAAMRFLEQYLGRKVGASTGTNLHAAFVLMSQMIALKEPGSVVTLICDAGERYRETYYNDAWIEKAGLDLLPHTASLEHFAETGLFPSTNSIA